jgi:Ca2+/Na+ antiporter
LETAWIFFFSFFTLAAACYLLFITSDPLEEVGGKIGKLLKLPEDVIASTFQALATSGPEIVMAILAASPFIASEVWSTLELGERASSGTLNMAFSAMDNLLGIGAVAMIFHIKLGKVDNNDSVPMKHSTQIGLVFYIFASGCLSVFMLDSVLSFSESWTLMIIGIVFILSQFFIPAWLKRKYPDEIEEGDDDDEYKVPSSPIVWTKEMTIQSFIYIALVFGLIIFVRECLSATFNLATIGVASVGGILIMFTSYVSSFPEFMMSYRYVIADKKSELLGMLFGSNVIDLAFAGFRSIWLREDMAVYTTGRFPGLLPVYIWLLPTIAICLLIALKTQAFKWKHAYPLVAFYLCYIVSGFILL